MKIISLDTGDYFLAPVNLNTQELENEFILSSNTEVEKFAAQYLKKIFRTVFGYMINLERIYSEYYHQEYFTFKEFLYKKELISREEIETLFGNLNQNETIFKLDFSHINYNVLTLFEHEDRIINKINIVLERCMK